jgi:hypothetical protein
LNLWVSTSSDRYDHLWRTIFHNEICRWTNTKALICDRRNICSDIGGKWKRKDKKSTEKVNICFVIVLLVDRIIRTIVESDRSAPSLWMNFCRKCYHVLLFLILIKVSRLKNEKWTFSFIMCKNLANVTSCARVCRM